MVERTVLRLLDKTPASVAARFAPSSRASRAAKPFVDRLLPRRPVAVTVRRGRVGGARLLVDPRHEKFYWTGLHEVEVQAALQEVLAPGGTCWDLGAHAGFFTVLASRAVGAHGAVHAFEPSPDSAARLEWAISANRLANVYVHREALGAEDGEAPLHFGGSSLTATLVAGRAPVVETVRVRRRTVDALAAEFGVPDAMKIDVEGSELDVLRGGAATFAERRTAIVIELSSADREAAARELLPGYTASRVSQSNWLFEPGESGRLRPGQRVGR